MQEEVDSFADQESETMDHLLLCCVFSREVWSVAHLNKAEPAMAFEQPAGRNVVVVASLERGS